MVQAKIRKVKNNSLWYTIAVGRLLMGFIFLWAFLDKLYGLHYSTPTNQAWIHGGSPTRAFLSSAHGPIAGIFHAMAGQSWADWLFMIGLAGIGLALLTGVAVRIAVVTGSILLALMWAAALPIRATPVIDDHIIYVVLLWIVFFGYRHQVLSLGAWWRGSIARWRWLW